MKFRAQLGDLILSILAIAGGLAILVLTRLQGLQLVKDRKSVV